MTDQPTHACIIESKGDPFAVTPMFLCRCRCHMTTFITWRPGDPARTCPVSGAPVTPPPGVPE